MIGQAMRRPMRSLSVLLLAALPAGPALADTKAGVEAWQRGDYRAAVQEWRTAAARGDPDAQFNLGQAYKLGRGVLTDTRRAEDYYRQAAAQGHVEAADNYGLALFQNGKPRDAVPYLEKSAARGEARAQYILGTMLFNGTDVPQDWVRAYALMTRSARGGLPQASDTLAQMDQFIPAADRERGLALADQAPPPPAAPTHKAAVIVRKPDRQPPPARIKPPVAAPIAGRWRLQLGSFADPANAQRRWSQVAGRFPGRSVGYERAGSYVRVMVGPFPSRAAAQAACRALDPCRPIGP